VLLYFKGQLMQESTKNCQCNHVISSASFLLLGLAAGSAAALLLAPLTGRQLRNRLGERMDDGRQAVKARVRESWSKATGAVNETIAMVEREKEALAEEFSR
jgi:gas vesicle protein